MVKLHWFASIFIKFVTMLVCFAYLNAQAYSPKTENEKDLHTLISTAYTGSINQEQAEQFALLFTEDAIRVPPSRAPESTRNGIQTGIEKVFGVFDFDVAIDIESINVDGDLALVQGVASGVRNKTVESKKINFQARSVWVCKREDGEWKIWRQVFYPIKIA